jgi:flagellar hook-associated protein 1 FlgK
MGEFFATWQTLSQNPESSASRAAVREQATTLVNTFHHLSRRLSDLERSLNQEVTGKVSQINQMSSEIAGLNREIGRHELSGTAANDLRDRRDLLIDQLSGIVNVNVLENAQGNARVFLGSMEIVGGTAYTELSTMSVNAGTQSHSEIVWKNSTLTVDIKGGELTGLLEARDQLVPSFRAMLDDLAGALVAQVNALHTSGTGLDGTTGDEFFAPGNVTAANITLDNSVLGDLNKIAASQSGAIGDNANAIAIANLQNALGLNNNTSTFSDYYAQLVSSAGRRSAEAMDAKSTSELVIQQIEFSRQSVQGVSLDEEMAELIKAQHAYDAAARVITTMDRALDTLMGLIR